MDLISFLSRLIGLMSNVVPVGSCLCHWSTVENCKSEALGPPTVFFLLWVALAVDTFCISVLVLLFFLVISNAIGILMKTAPADYFCKHSQFHSINSASPAAWTVIKWSSVFFNFFLYCLRVFIVEVFLIPRCFL